MPERFRRRKRVLERPHNPKVVGSNPAPATTIRKGFGTKKPDPFLFLNNSSKTKQITKII
jgi:hypothetical protein